MDGFLFIDKEKGMTSFDVVREVRRIVGEKKVGHSGTLDKAATGLLILALGRGTKLLEYLIGCGKEYEVLARFGYVSDTYDGSGEIVKGDLGVKIGEVQLVEAIKRKFLGEISQMPPKYSALKVGGKRASDIVRGGGEVDLKPRKVKIEKFEIMEYAWPKVSFRVECSSGTYIRSLVHDLGGELGCGAYVEELRRVGIRNFSVSDACLLGELDKKVEQRLVSLEEMGRDFPFLELSDEEFEGLKDGKVLLDKKLEQEGVVMAFCKGKLVGVLEKASEGIKYSKCLTNN